MADARELLRQTVSGILQAALSGQEPKYLYGEKYIRWGLVEKDIHAAIDRAYLANPAPTAPPRSPFIVDGRLSGMSAVPTAAVGVPPRDPTPEILERAQRIADRPPLTEQQIIDGGVAFIMGPGGDEGTRRAEVGVPPRSPSEKMLAAAEALNPPFGTPEQLTEEYGRKWRERVRRGATRQWQAMYDAAEVGVPPRSPDEAMQAWNEEARAGDGEPMFGTCAYCGKSLKFHHACPGNTAPSGDAPSPDPAQCPRCGSRDPCNCPGVVLPTSTTT